MDQEEIDSPGCRARSELGSALPSLLMFAAFCFFSPLHSFAQTRVVTSIAPLAGLVRAVASESISPQILVSSKSDPHTFELSPGDLISLTKADLVILTHPAIEFWYDDLEVSMKEKTLWLAQGVRPQELDIHYWLDPRIAVEYARRITDKLCAFDSARCSEFRRSFDTFAKECADLERSIHAEISTWSEKRYIAAHPAWRAFADRFGMEERAVLQEREGRQATMREIARIVQLARDERVSRFLVERTTPFAPLESFLAEAGLTPVVVDSIGDEGESYRQLIERNVAQLRRYFKEQ